MITAWLFGKEEVRTQWICPFPAVVSGLARACLWACRESTSIATLKREIEIGARKEPLYSVPPHSHWQRSHTSWSAEGRAVSVVWWTINGRGWRGTEGSCLVVSGLTPLIPSITSPVTWKRLSNVKDSEAWYLVHTIHAVSFLYKGMFLAKIKS